jgi:L-seryl-tRNA(Ser) seleniumtransferase
MDETTRMERLRALPSIDELLARPTVSSLLSTHSRQLGVSALREAVAQVRQRILAGEDVRFDEHEVVTVLARLSGPKLKRVINATGVVLHTNLGRAPLAPHAIARLAHLAGGYSNLELDLDEGERGSRYAPVVELLCQLTGAEDAMVVNNCAAAVLLAFGALAKGKEAIVSRGELVEIGGGFRIPEVMQQSGATLVEVGTTNRTRIDDYERAITPQTGLIAKISRSNFAIVGFTEEAHARELGALGRARQVPVFIDVGSGLLRALHAEGVPSEPTIASVVSSGVDLVGFSGDKLLGGPQAGLIVGDKDLIARIKRNPLKRALRLDKMTLAALEAVLKLYRDPDRLAQRLPTLRLLSRTAADIQTMAEHLAPQVAQALGTRARVQVLPCRSQIGSGSLPVDRLDSACLALGAATGRQRAGRLPEQLAAAFRALPVPVIGRIEDGQLRLDLRCLEDAQLQAFVEQLPLLSLPPAG